MEKINSILGEIETALKSEVKLDVLEGIRGNLISLNMLIKQTIEKGRAAGGPVAGKGADVSIEAYFKQFEEEISGVNKNFTGIIDLTKKLETDEALRQFLIKKIESIFGGIAEGAGRAFNLSTLEIFDEMMEELRGTMEQKLIAGIRKELFSIKTNLGEFEKIYGVMEEQFSGIYGAIANMKQKFQNQMKAIRVESEIVKSVFPKITELAGTLALDYEKTRKELGDAMTTIRRTPLELLNKLKPALASLEIQSSSQQNILKVEQLRKQGELEVEQVKLKTELEMAKKRIEELEMLSKDSDKFLKDKEQLLSENQKMRAELDEVSRHLEKVTGEFEHLAKKAGEEDKKIEMTGVLALVMTLLVEVFGAQPHSKLLFLLHGQQSEMNRTSLIKASGISGAMVRKALADLDGAKLVKYDVETETATLLKRIL